MKNSVIYNIRNTINDNIYIGSAIDFASRKRVHLCQLRKGNHHSISLQRAFKKYGEENMIFEIIEYVSDKSKLIQREQFWIDFFKPTYNISKIAGSRLGVPVSEETRKKLSASQKKHFLKYAAWNKGKKIHSEETKLKISNIHRGNKYNLCRIPSKETKEKMSLAKKGKKSGFHGKNHSAETKNKIADILSKYNYNKRPEYREKMSSVIKEWWRKRKEDNTCRL